MKRRTLLSCILASGCVLVSSQSFAQATDEQALYAAAQKEGPLVVYSDFSNQIWAPIVREFTAKYPGLEVQTLDIEQREMAERYFAEKSAGVHFASLIVNNYDEMNRNYITTGEILDYDLPAAAQFPEWSKPFPGVYAMSVDPVVMTWNKLVIPDDKAPHSLAALAELVAADPGNYKGKITTYSPEKDRLSYATYKVTFKTNGEETGWKIYETLGPATKFEVSTGTMVQKIVSGEYLVAYNAASAPVWSRLKDPAFEQILGWSFIEDGTPASPRFVGIPVDAPSLNSAKLLLGFLVSKEGQLAIAEGGRTIYHPDVNLSELAKGQYCVNGIVDAIGEDKLIVLMQPVESEEKYNATMGRLKKIYNMKK